MGSVSLSGFVVSYRSGSSGFVRFTSDPEYVASILDYVVKTTPFDGDTISVDQVGSEPSVNGRWPVRRNEVEMTGSGGSWRKR